MPGFFKRFFLSDYGPPPAPDVAHQPSFVGQRVVETIYSESRNIRAIITADDIGIYRIYSEFWDTSDWKAGHGAFWSGGGTGSRTDSVERARELAHEAAGDLHHAI